MVEFDPNNPLSEKELDKLGEENFDDFLNYLDQKAEHLKQFTKPLSSYHTRDTHLFQLHLKVKNFLRKI